MFGPSEKLLMEEGYVKKAINAPVFIIVLFMFILFSTSKVHQNRN
jgi:hypothetical protein